MKGLNNNINAFGLGDIVIGDNVMIDAGCFGEDLHLEHFGSVIVNPKARIGKGCIIHGNCCIGSNGRYPEDSPVIGNHVDIGQNAQILGGIRVADNVRTGAGAVVVKDILTPGVIVVGVPAKEKCNT